MSIPRVSVVVATNRLSPYLAQGLASVRDQTRGDWEVVVVGDGVPDPAALDAQVRDALGASGPRGTGRVRVLHRPARGVSVARNTGAAAARGEYLAFLDDDDVWHPDRLALQVARLDTDPVATACSCDGWLLGPDGERLPEAWPVTTGSRLDLLSGRVDIPRIVTLTFRREAFAALGGFHPSFRFGEDNELTLRTVRLGRVVAVPEALVGYRRHPGGVTARLGPGQDPGERIIRLTLAGAEADGDAEAVAALTANLRAFRTRAAARYAGAARHAARRRDWRLVASSGAGALRSSPAAGARALLLGPRPVPPAAPVPTDAATGTPATADHAGGSTSSTPAATTPAATSPGTSPAASTPAATTPARSAP